MASNQQPIANGSAALSSVTPSSPMFTVFSALPIEIQDSIWEIEATARAKVVEITVDDLQNIQVEAGKPTSLLHINSHTREMALRSHDLYTYPTIALDQALLGLPVRCWFFDRKHDTMYLRLNNQRLYDPMVYQLYFASTSNVLINYAGTRSFRNDLRPLCPTPTVSRSTMTLSIIPVLCARNQHLAINLSLPPYSFFAGGPMSPLTSVHEESLIALIEWATCSFVEYMARFVAPIVQSCSSDVRIDLVIPEEYDRNNLAVRHWHGFSCALGGEKEFVEWNETFEVDENGDHFDHVYVYEAAKYRSMLAVTGPSTRVYPARVLYLLRDILNHIIEQDEFYEKLEICWKGRTGVETGLRMKWPKIRLVFAKR